MGEYIEREALPKKKERGFFHDDDFNAGWNACLNAIAHIPPADVRPVVRGHWRSRFYYRESTNAHDCEMHVCSECGSEWSYDAETGLSYNFCPNCGAKMED